MSQKYIPVVKFLPSLALVGVLVALLPHAWSEAPTEEEQKNATPEEVLQDLMEGNKRFAAGKVTVQDIEGRIGQTFEGQFPKAYILSCVDSRVPVEKVFDQSIGDVFVGRVAGNVEDLAQLGSMEFATAVAGSKLVIVLGHENCGAVKGACDHVKLGNLTQLLHEISASANDVTGVAKEDRNSKNLEYVNAVVESNVVKTIADIRARSEVLSDLEKEGKIKIVGAVYSLQTGKVELLEETEEE